MLTSPRNTNKLFIKTMVVDASELVNSTPVVNSPLIECPEQEDATSSPLLKNKINRKNLELQKEFSSGKKKEVDVKGLV